MKYGRADPTGAKVIIGLSKSKLAEFRHREVFTCALCDEPATFYVEDTPVGIRGFCTEKHYAEYMGLPFVTEGWYGVKNKNPIGELKE